MAISATIEINDDATSMLERMQTRLKPETVNRVAGRAGQNFVRDHFVDLNRKRPNKLGGKRTNFYTQAARGTTFTSDSNSANVSVNQVGIRQRIQGGVILPKNAKFLTLPAIAEAHGRRAREFSDLKFGMVEDEQGRPRKALVRENGNASDENWVTDQAVFWLVPRVVQRPDPSVMPDLRKMRDRILADLAKLIRIREAKQNNGGGVA